MVKRAQGPGLYTDIGQKIRGLLYTDYPPTPKFSLTASRSHGEEAITCVGTKKDDSFYAVVRTGSENYNTVTYARVDTNPRHFASTTYNEIKVAPGLKAVLGFTHQNSYKVGLKYRHNYGGIITGVRFMENPCLDLSGVIGTNFLSLGTDVTFNTTTRSFSKYNFGCSTSINNMIFSLNLNDKCDTVKTSYYTCVSSGQTAFGVEFAHAISTRGNCFTVGCQHELSPFTTVKTRYIDYRKFSALIQHEILPMTRLTIYGEIDTINLWKWPKFGMGLDLKIHMGLALGISYTTVTGHFLSIICIDILLETRVLYVLAKAWLLALESVTTSCRWRSFRHHGTQTRAQLGSVASSCHGFIHKAH